MKIWRPVYIFQSCLAQFVLDRWSCSDQNTCYVQKRLYENQAVYWIMWENTVEPDRPHMTVWRMPCACWIPKATNSHSEYVILITFPLAQSRAIAPQCYVTRAAPVLICMTRLPNFMQIEVTVWSLIPSQMDGRRNIVWTEGVLFCLWGIYKLLDE